MQVNNPTSMDRLCPQLGENLAAFGVRQVSDGFEKCEGCRCVVFGDPGEPEPAEPETTEAE